MLPDALVVLCFVGLAVYAWRGAALLERDSGTAGDGRLYAWYLRRYHRRHHGEVPK